MTAPTTGPGPAGHGAVEAAPPPTVGRRELAAVAVTTALAVVAGLELRRVLPLDRLVLPVVLGALAAAAGPLAARWRSLPAVIGPLVAVVLGLVVVGATVDGSGAVAGVLPGPTLLRTVADAAVNGWAQLLSTGIPAPPRATMVLVAPLLAWTAAWLGAELVLRTRTPVLGALPPLAALVGASVLVVPAGGSRLPAAVLLAVGAGVLLLLGRPGRAGDDLPTARPLRAAAMGLAVVVLGVAVAPHLPWIGDAPTRDPRPDEPVPERQVTPVNPLTLLAGWAAAPDEVVAVVRADRPVPLRLGVLDRYDGTSWSASTVLQVAGATLPPDRVGEAAAGDRVTQRITLRDLPGVFLPAAEQPVAYEGPAAWWDARHGVLYRQSTVTGPGAVRYEVTSAVPPAAPDELGDRPVDAADPLTLDVPDAPAVVSSLALQATPDGSTPYAKSLLLADYLQDQATFDADAPSGSSWSRLEFFLVAEPEDGGRRGTSEQFATAFAVMARLQGLPARVVVGAVPPRDLAPGAEWTVRAGDLEAWPEVRFEGAGWVRFDPTPARTDAPPPSTTTTSSPPTTQPDLPPEETAASTAPGTPGDGDGEADAVRSSTGLGARLGRLARPAGLAVLLVVLALPLVVVLLKALRRRRRASGSVRDRVLGAWSEAVDVVRGRGVAVSTAASRPAVAQRATDLLGTAVGRELAQLAVLADEVSFREGHPPEELAVVAWDRAAGVRAGAASGQPLGRRLLRTVDPRTLRPPRPERDGSSRHRVRVASGPHAPRPRPS